MSEAKSKAQVFGARLFSTLLLIGIVAGTFVSMNPWAYLSLVSFLAIAASHELFRMMDIGKMPCQQKWGRFVAIAYTLTVAALLASCGGDALPLLGFVDGTAITLVVLSSFILQLREPIEGRNPLIKVASTVLSFLYVPFLFSFIGRLLFVPEAASVSSFFHDVPGAMVMLWLICVTKFTDIGAYCTGSLIGKHKMIPHISPGKTWQGFFGALVWAVVVGCVVYAIGKDSLQVLGGWGHVVVLSLILSLLTVTGDLAESVIKRSLEVKDSGNTLPGIGGALDLIDSLCFTAPALYFYLCWVV
ncbi:phosphatidate cytidylyltransferase [Rubritalea spongiae]|uniref:Phosphatidate cytidylyltransferase n=1 Tax=Rubritalea spongiae TaxID=430797 RepID=A0ABW5DY03_9BACT